MTIMVDKLSLLAALTPLQIKTELAVSRQDSSRFAQQLDSVVKEGQEIVTQDKAKELAETLTLQMLQTTLSLGGDGTTGAGQQLSSPAVTPLSVLLKSYSVSSGESSVQQKTAVEQRNTQLPQIAPDKGAVPTPVTTFRQGADTDWLDPIIARAAGKYGVEGSLIKAVIKAESNFNPRAVSHAGAQGLMQLMPATARSLGVSDSFDPEQNVMAGTRFLKDMLHRYNGDVDAALAAYNWGPGNVDRRPDRLPRETRDYLARVKQLYTTYSS